MLSWGKGRGWLYKTPGGPRRELEREPPRMECALQGMGGHTGPPSRKGGGWGYEVRQGWILSLPLSCCDMWAMSPHLSEPQLPCL